MSYQRSRSRDDRRGTSQIDSALIQVGQASCEVTGVLLPVVSGPGWVDLSSRAPNQELRVPGCQQHPKVNAEQSDPRTAAACYPAGSITVLGSRQVPEVRLNNHPDVPLLPPQKVIWKPSLMGAAQSPGYRASMGVSTAISGLEVLRSPQGQQLGQPCDLHVQYPVAAAPETYSPIPLSRNPRQNQRSRYTLKG